MVSVRQIIGKITKVKGRSFNLSTKRLKIPKSSTQEFIQSLADIATVEISDGREERTSNLKIEKDEDGKKIYINVISFPKKLKGLEPLFTFFKTIPGRYYEQKNKRWRFDLAHEKVLMDGIKKIGIRIFANAY